MGLGYNLGSDDASLWGTGRRGGEKVRGNTLPVPGGTNSRPRREGRTPTSSGVRAPFGL